jgi:hypothetical protein
MKDSRIKIAVLDDYQNIALQMADWSSLPGNPEINVTMIITRSSRRID